MTQDSTEDTEKRKPKNINFTIILAVLCGALLMYVGSDFLDKKSITHREEAAEYKELTNVLIDIHGGMTAGINKVDWNTN